MAKRFTDTNKYKKPFLRGLKGAYKVLWDYLYHDCDHAGVWIVDFEIAQIYIGKDLLVNKKDALKYFNQDEIRIVEIDNGEKWFIPSFITFQYGPLNENNRAHNSVIQILEKYNLLNDKGHLRTFEGPKEKDKDKNKEKEKLPKEEVEPKKKVAFDEEYNFFIEGFNKITGRKFRGDDKTKRQFKTLRKNGYTWSDCKKAITNLYKDEFHKKNNFKHATPELLTRPEKFEMFLNASESEQKGNVYPGKIGKREPSKVNLLKKIQGEINNIQGFESKI